ncbi:hypothetical protein AURDEDRAFT_136541 [Auricularia subglabra TFB-10046 SS5]|nr:hypothetical protein AURDEDRAFT_136541 [Auricularia subglabra TFB-10046 SS5]
MHFKTLAAFVIAAAAAASAAPAKRQDAQLPTTASIWLARSEQQTAPEATGAYLIKDGLVFQYSSAPAAAEESEMEAELPAAEAYTIIPLGGTSPEDQIVRIQYNGHTCRKRGSVYLDCLDLDGTLPEFFLRAKYRADQGKWELLGGARSFSTLPTQDQNIFQVAVTPGSYADVPGHVNGWSMWLEEAGKAL